MQKFGSNTEDIQAIFLKAQKLREEQANKSVTVEEIEIGDEKTEEPSTPSTDVITLTGIMISQDGVISKSRYFDSIAVDAEKYHDVVFTPEEAQRISSSLRRMSTGVNASIPMICRGADCTFSGSCPYMAINRAPIGRPCLVEAQLVEYWTKQFIEEFDVDPSNITELHLVSELAEFNIYEKRVTEYLAIKHPTLLQDITVGFSAEGEPLTNTEISRAFDLKERIKRNRMKVLESLMATRKERVKSRIGVSSGISTAEKLSDLKNKLDQINDDMRKMKPIEGTIIDEQTE